MLAMLQDAKRVRFPQTTGKKRTFSTAMRITAQDRSLARLLLLFGACEQLSVLRGQTDLKKKSSNPASYPVYKQPRRTEILLRRRSVGIEYDRDAGQYSPRVPPVIQLNLWYLNQHSGRPTAIRVD